MLIDNVDLTGGPGWEFFQKLCALAPSRRPANISKTSTPQEHEVYFQRAGFSGISHLREDLWIITHGVKAPRS